MFKEAGYDEFLAEQIRLGEADFHAKRFVTSEQSLREIQQLILNAERELTTQQDLPLDAAYG